MSTTKQALGTKFDYSFGDPNTALGKLLYWANTSYVSPQAYIANRISPNTMDNNKQYFNELLMKDTAKNMALGLGVGAGATGLYHLARHALAGRPPKPANEEKTAEGPPLSAAPHIGQNFMNGMMMTGTGISAIAGAKLMNDFVKSRKKKQYMQQVEEARKLYEDSLLGAKSAALDSAFDTFAEKKALTLTPIHDIVKGLATAEGMATAGAGALGAKMMYDWTRGRSQAALLAKAQDAKARMSALPPMWVSPDEITTLKKKQQLAEKEPAHETEQKAATV